MPGKPPRKRPTPISVSEPTKIRLPMATSGRVRAASAKLAIAHEHVDGDRCHQLAEVREERRVERRRGDPQPDERDDAPAVRRARQHEDRAVAQVREQERAEAEDERQRPVGSASSTSPSTAVTSAAHTAFARCGAGAARREQQDAHRGFRDGRDRAAASESIQQRGEPAVGGGKRGDQGGCLRFVVVCGGRRAVEGAAVGHYPEERTCQNRRILLGSDRDRHARGLPAGAAIRRCRARCVGAAAGFFRALPRLNRGNDCIRLAIAAVLPLSMWLLLSLSLFRPDARLDAQPVRPMNPSRARPVC